MVRLGYAIKLLAIAKNNVLNMVLAFVVYCYCVPTMLLPVSHPLFSVNEIIVFNAIFVTLDLIVFIVGDWCLVVW